MTDLSWLKLVRTAADAADRVESLPEVVGDGVGGGDRLPPGLDLDGAVAAGGRDELADGPARGVLDLAADGHGGEHDREVGFDGVALAVVNRPGLQVAFGHPE